MTAEMKRPTAQRLTHRWVKGRTVLGMVLPVIFLLSACQSHAPGGVRELSMRFAGFSTADQDVSGVALVHCSGGAGCEFTALNGVQLFDPKTGDPLDYGKAKAILRYESPADNNGSQFFLALTSAPHDVDVDFYPINRQRAEHLSLTHRFRAGHRYDLSLYRQQRETSGSLLSLAGPAPLCVDLLDNKEVVRRFCHFYDFQATSSGFVEQKLR